MKINILTSTRSGGKFASSAPHMSVTGEQVIGPEAPEDNLITSIDESRMSDEKVMAVQFLTFLSNRRLTMESLKQLPIEEQARLKKEFIG